MLLKIKKLPLDGKINQKRSIYYNKRGNMSKAFEISTIRGGIRGLHLPAILDF
jgi:hypothetical protein